MSGVRSLPILCAVAVCWLAATFGVAQEPAQPSKPAAEKPAKPELTQAQLDALVARLIKDLGASQYATRERAQAELRRLGLAAFDGLHDAQYNEDIEIALRARYLVRSMRVTWWRDTDTPDVKRILKSYGQQAEAERKNRMDKLAKLAEGAGIDALCRLVRFETSNVLSKHAALLVMNHPMPESDEQQTQLGNRIRRNIGLSKRPAATWAKAYGATLAKPESQLRLWKQLTQQEQETLAQFPAKSSREITRDLLRWHAELLRRLKRREEALAVIRQSLNLVEGTREQLLDIVDWLMVREIWSIVDEVSQRFPGPFTQDPQLLYRLAEAQLKQGKKADADATAAKAQKLNTTDPGEHILVAYALQERGLFEWSEQEYRLALDSSEAGSLDALRTRFLLSELLHDGNQELEAARTLQVVVDGMNKDKQILQRVASRFNREPGAVRSRMHFFYALHFAAEGDQKKQLEHLRQGVKDDPQDADLLIAMYRVKGADDAWRKETSAHIKKATAAFLKQINEYQQQIESSPQEEFRAWANRQLATAHNQFAWLVGNTEGDYEAAVRSSHRSLELRPNAAGFLDTLGRCYYSNGDLENAVKYQARAVKLEPHSRQIQRQLELFQKELAERKAKATPAK